VQGQSSTAWSACTWEGQGPYLVQISGAPTIGVTVDGFDFDMQPPGPFGGPIAFNVVAWNDGYSSLPGTVFVASVPGGCNPRTPPHVLTYDSALDGPLVGAIRGTPLAGGLVIWTEQSTPTRRLMATVGTVPGCEHDVVVAPLRSWCRAKSRFCWA
jgi:hypothetical protein